MKIKKRQPIRADFRCRGLQWIMKQLDKDVLRVEKSSRKKLAKHPSDPEALLCLGAALWQRGQPLQAINPLVEFVRRVPTWAPGHHILASLLDQVGEYERAQIHAKIACELDPYNLEARKLRTRLLLTLSRWREAWELSVKTARVQGNPLLTFADISVQGKTVLLSPDAFAGGPENVSVPLERLEGSIRDYAIVERKGSQDASLGDTLMFCRYIARLSQQGASVIVIAQKPVVSILHRCFRIPVLAPGEIVPSCTFHSRLTQMPFCFGDTPATIPKTVPYLCADPARQERWRVGISKTSALRIGLCYAGDARLDRDKYRSVPLRFFRPLAEILGVVLYSLQIPPASEQVKSAGFPVIDLGGRFDLSAGFEDIAAAMTELDLILACDSAPAHLAGALARPVWMLLSRTHRDYRWELQRDASPWYPSMRIFRQKSPGDWAELMQRLARELQKEVTKRLAFPMTPPTTEPRALECGIVQACGSTSL